MAKFEEFETNFFAKTEQLDKKTKQILGELAKYE